MKFVASLSSEKPVEQWKKPSCLGYLGDDTTQLNRDYNNPL